MSFLTKFSLKNPIAIIILSILLAAGGVYAITSLKVDLLPNIDVPALTIQSVYPGASPTDMDQKITQKLDQKFKSISGIKKMTSHSYESVSLIQLEFPLKTDMEKMKQKVNDLIKETSLPEQVKPTIFRFNFSSFPILNFAMFAKGNNDIQDLVVNEIKPALEKIPGVNSVAVGGTKTNYVEIVIDKAKAKQYHLSLQQIEKKIKDASFSFPAGTVNVYKLVVPVRVEEQLKTINELKSLSFSVQSGTPQPQTTSIALGDIAAVHTASETPEIIRYNQKNSLSLSVTKKQDTNTVEVADKVYQVMDQYKDKIDSRLVFDQALSIKKSVNNLIREGLFGALFASLAVLLFLRNVRATIIAILSIPLSILVASIFLSRGGITLNVMTLGGMAVAVGRVVDDSIVVIENIFRRMKENKAGVNKTQVTADATKEMVNAITASTLTTIVVFLPLGLVGGITGEFFMPFALTIVFSLIASLLIAVTIVPVLARFSFSRVKHTDKKGWMQKKYTKILKTSLNHKTWTIFIALFLLVGSIGAYAYSKPGIVFIPNQKQKIVAADFTLPPATSIKETNDVSLQIENLLHGEKDKFKYIFAQIGARDFQTGVKNQNRAQYFMELKDQVNVDETINQLSKQLGSIVRKASSQGTVSVQEMSSGGPPTNDQVTINLYSTDQSKLQEASNVVEQSLLKNKDLKYVTNNFQQKQTEWTVTIDPIKADKYGISAFMILGLISDETRPVTIGDYRLDGKDQQIRLRYDKGITSSNEIANIPLFSAEGPVLLKDIAKVKQENAVSSIQRLDDKVYASISAKVNAKDVQGVSNQVIQYVQKLKMPEGVRLETSSGSQETADSFKQIQLAIFSAIGLVYLVMLVAFGKARIPFIILSSLFFIPIGAVAGLYITDQPISISAMIGLLMLIGIVVTNAIVLVDRVGQNRNRGLNVREALIEAGSTRLRPILMTAFATICALTPLALTESDGNLISKGLAVVVIGGLITSTLLTLVIVPIVYELFFSRQYRKEKRLARGKLELGE